MKHAFKLAFGSVLAISALVSACAKGGGSTASTPTSGTGSTGACVYDSSGNCTLQIGPAGYVGDGQWQNQLTVSNAAILQQLASDNGACATNGGMNQYGYGNGWGMQSAAFGGGIANCAALWPQIQLNVRLATGGCLPGTGQFNLTFLGQNNMSMPLQASAPAYQNSASNGFFLNYASGSGNGAGFNGGYNQSTTVPATSLQINMQPTDGTHNTMNVQLYYRGQQFASGQLTGAATFNSGAASAGAQYCGGNGQTQSGFGQTGGFGNQGFGGQAYGNNGFQNTGWSGGVVFFSRQNRDGNRW